jgi:hypothetical protein
MAPDRSHILVVRLDTTAQDEEHRAERAHALALAGFPPLEPPRTLWILQNSVNIRASRDLDILNTVNENEDPHDRRTRRRRNSPPPSPPVPNVAPLPSSSSHEEE